MKSSRTAIALLSAFLAVQMSKGRGEEKPAAPESFFPVAVWYGGGKARAPMLEAVDASSAERWGKDLDQIKSVDRKSTRLNSSHGYISYAVFCLKKKKRRKRLTSHNH